MKKTFLTISLIAAVFLSKAQFGNKGQQLIGGSISFNQQKQDNPNNASYYVSNNSGFAINLLYGKFVKQNVLSAFGVSLANYSQTYTTPSPTVENKTTNQNYGAFYNRTNYKEVAKKLFVGLSSNVNLGLTKSKSTTSNSSNYWETTGYYGNVGLSPVLSYQFSNRVVGNLTTTNSFLNLAYNYSKANYYNTNTLITSSKNTSINAGLGLNGSILSNIAFGFSYLLRK